MSRDKLSVAVAALIMTAVPGGGLAQDAGPRSDRTICLDEAATAPERVITCTRVIDAGVRGASGADLHAARAEAYVAGNRIADAITDYETAERLDRAGADRFARAHAETLNRAGNGAPDGDLRLAYFDRAVAKDETFSNSYSNRGNYYREHRMPELALNDLNRAISLDPQNAHAYLFRGIFYRTNGDNVGARADFDAALAINPSFADAYANRGFLRQAARDYQGAITDYDQALTIEPRSGNTLTQRGMARSRLGDHAGAVADLERGLSLSPDSGGLSAYNDLGVSHNALGQYERAVAAFDRAMGYGSDPVVGNNRAMAAQRLNAQYQQQENARLALVRQQEQARLDQVRAECLERQRRLNAQTESRQMGNLLTGLVSMAAGDNASAQQQFNQAGQGRAADLGC